MKRKLRDAFAALLTPVLMLTLLGCVGGTSNQQSSYWPEIQIDNADGVAVNTASFNTENVLVVSFWSTWCVPCRRELPQLQKFADANSTVSIVAVNLGDDAPSVRAYADELGLTMPILIDVYGRISSSVGVATVPATILVRNEQVVAKHLGEISAEQLADLVKQTDQSS